jgi:fructokinase
MNMIALGETTYDIFFKNGKPLDAKVGGSSLNTAVSLGRLGVPVSMVTAYGSDDIGHITTDFLKDNHIDSSFVTVYQGTSRIALAFLDEQNNAHFTFYEGRRLDDTELVFPGPGNYSLVVFGSGFAFQPGIRPRLVQFLEQTRCDGNIVYYDPNVRPAQMAGNEHAKTWILENFRLSHIVKGSREDFGMLFNTQSSQAAYQAVKEFNSNVVLLVTAGEQGADLFTPFMQKHIDALSISPVSTVGAGDTFSAGILYGLYQAQATTDNLLLLPGTVWDQALQYAVDFATEVCLSFDNYISKRW